MQDAVRAYVQDQIAPHAARWDREHHFPAEQLKGLAALGCYGVAVPTEYDGAGLDYLALALILEEIAGGRRRHVHRGQRQQLPGLLDPDGLWQRRAERAVPEAAGAWRLLGAFCLTEPHVGSEAGGLKTTAVRVQDGDGDGYVLNGVKQFITSGQNGDVAIVMAVTDKAAGKKGISAFLVPTATPGYTVARLEDKMGQHSSDTAQINFENCRIPAAWRLGEEGQGLKIALSGLEGWPHRHRRAGGGHGAGGVRGGPALQQGTHHLRPADLSAPGSAVPPGRHGHADRGPARQLIWHAASLKDAGLPCLKEAAMAKLFASEMAERVCSAAIQTLGGYGYVSDFPVERIYRDVRVCQIYEGTSDVQKILIGRALA